MAGITTDNIDQYALTPSNINDVAEVIASLGEYDFIYLLTYKAGAYSLSRIELSVLKTAMDSGLSADDIINNLTSTATDKALSAAQGKVLKEGVDNIYASIKSNINILRAAVNTLSSALANLAFKSTNPNVNVGAFTWPAFISDGGSTPSAPTLTYPADNSTTDVGTNTGSGVTKTIPVQGSDLTQALTVSVIGTGFSVSPTTISAAAANAGALLTITYNGTAENADGTLTISSTEVSATVSLTASYSSSGGDPDDPEEPSGYVTDNLVLHLDCKTGLDASNNWVSCEGNGYEFQTTDVIASDNGMVFNGSTSEAICDDILDNVLFSNGTIEVVIADIGKQTVGTSNGTFNHVHIFTNEINGGIAFSIWDVNPAFGVVYGAKTSANSETNNKYYRMGDFGSRPTTISGRFSINDNMAVVDDNDGVSLTSSVGTNMLFTTNGDNKMRVGFSLYGQVNYHVTGKILAIRVYNTKLTEAQMKSNHAYDKIYYNLT